MERLPIKNAMNDFYTILKDYPYRPQTIDLKRIFLSHQ